jgi:hypothetical protein
MQVERVQICAHKLLENGFYDSWFIPLTQNATVNDILNIFAQFLIDGERVPYPILQSCFDVLLRSNEERMFVFMKRGTTDVVGIMRSNKPLCSVREIELLKQTGQTQQWNIPLWTWKDSHFNLTRAMESQCLNVKGQCIGIWAYR